MKKIHLFWIIPLTIILAVFGWSALTFQAEKDIFVLGTTLSCYDGCYNMLEINYGEDARPWSEDSIQKLEYDLCSNMCNVKYYDKYPTPEAFR